MKQYEIEWLRPQFDTAVENYRREDREDNGKKMSKARLGRKVGMHRGHVSSLLAGKRTLTAHYLILFVSGGVIKVSDVDFKPRNKKERELKRQLEMAAKKDFLIIASRIEEHGIDVTEFLKEKLDELER